MVQGLEQSQRASGRFRKILGGLGGPGSSEDTFSHQIQGQTNHQNYLKAKEHRASIFTELSGENGLGRCEETSLRKV